MDAEFIMMILILPVIMILGLSVALGLVAGPVLQWGVNRLTGHRPDFGSAFVTGWLCYVAAMGFTFVLGMSSYLAGYAMGARRTQVDTFLEYLAIPALVIAFALQVWIVNRRLTTPEGSHMGAGKAALANLAQFLVIIVPLTALVALTL